jgi:hypothetical protein
MLRDRCKKMLFRAKYDHVRLRPNVKVTGARGEARTRAMMYLVRHTGQRRHARGRPR